MTSCGLSPMDWEAHRGAEDYTSNNCDIGDFTPSILKIKLAVTLGTAQGFVSRANHSISISNTLVMVQ